MLLQRNDLANWGSGLLVMLCVWAQLDQALAGKGKKKIIRYLIEA